jgi:dTDP-4-dehydrorhamnose reductase
VKKILLTGKNGQVGWELQRTLTSLGQVIAVDSAALDLRDANAVRVAIREIRPDIIVNPAAYTAVDKAETEPEIAMAVNATAPAVMAEEAKKLGALLLHYSTDYIFDGSKQGTYQEDDTPNPLGVYGKSKLMGEQAIRSSGCNHLIFRTSWVYGARGKNFLLTMLRLAKERDQLRVVDDQIGAPTWSRTLAEIPAQILAQLYAPKADADQIAEVSGAYQLTSSGSVSWCGFTAEILRLAELSNSPVLHPITSAEYPTPAARPQNSVMSNNKLTQTFGLAAGDWQANLALCMQALKNN